MKPDDWSNLAYILAGLTLAIQQAYVPAFGLIFLGIASYIGHIEGGDWWLVDWAGMYLAMSAILLYNIGHPLYFWAVMAPIVLGTLVFRFDSFVFTGALWCAVVGSAYMAGLPIIIPIILFAIAFAFRQLGQVRNYQFNHSVWHLMTATGFYMLVK